MTPSDDQAFTEFLRQKTFEARELGYRPNEFLKMLGADGGYHTVSKLLAKKRPSDGFTKLWEIGRLDLSVEALVVETIWRAHFDEELLRLAEDRLKAVHYKFTPSTSLPVGSLKPDSLKEQAPPKKKALSKKLNTQSFSAFCELLGAPLKNVADRWCGISEKRRMAVFTVWADRLQGGRYVLWNDKVHPNSPRIGAKELGVVIETVMSSNYSTYGILCEAVDPKATIRKRGYFIEDAVLVLRFVKEPPGIVAYVEGEAPAAEVIRGHRISLKPFQSAEDDISPPPIGSTSPERTSRVVGGYRRDDAVRRHVQQRSGGRCEYCGLPGFELPNGSLYVEAHHVLTLAASGPDTVENVIALCANHHRQAHYGNDAEMLEAEFLAKLRILCSKG